MMMIRLLACMLVTLPVLGMAQVNPQFADLGATIEMVRSVAALERKAVIANGLELSGEAGADFWQLYDDYAADKKEINDRLVKLITDYAANVDTMTDDFAASVVDDHLDLQGDLLKLRKKYLRRFGKVLTPIELARFYQIENKLDAVVNVQLAQGIPLISL
jgi:hypothetical protein